jgi:hypothetical protein
MRPRHGFLPEVALRYVTLYFLTLPAFAGNVLSDKGYGPIHFGEKTVSLEKSLHDKAVPEDATDDPACRYVKFKKFPGVFFMEEAGVITRADAGFKKNVPNAYGIKIGTTLREVKRKHPQVLVEPHQYFEKGHYLIFESADKKSAVIFVEDEGKIKNLHAGLHPSVDYVEGCL